MKRKITNNSPEVELELDCKKIAEEWAKENIHGGYDIFYKKYRPIDIVIREKIEKKKILGNLITSSRRNEYEHFFECKLHKRNLGLEVLGKAYLITLRYKPKTLVIATKGSLTKQAIDFAHWLKEEINDFSCSTWSPDKIKNTPESEQCIDESYIEKYADKSEIIEWRLIEKSTFYRATISDERSENKKRYVIDSNKIYHFESTIKISNKKYDYLELKLEIYSNKGEKIDIPLRPVIGVNNCILISEIINLSNDNEGKILTKAFLRIESNLGEDIHSIENFPDLMIPYHTLYIKDFRGNKAENMFKNILNSSNSSIYMISGEGGIGKSYLCERICNIAKKEGFHVAHTTLSINSEPTFIRELMLALLPEKLQYIFQTDDFNEFTGNFIETFFEYFQNRSNKNECIILRNFLTCNKWDESDPELLLTIIIRILVYSNKHILLFLDNCHRLSNVCSRVLQAFFYVLENTDWASGKIKIILEYRNSEEDITQQWRNMQEWLYHNFSHRIQHEKLTALTNEELFNAINPVIISSDNKIVADLIFTKTSGNPLYITMLFQGLIENKILIPTSSNHVYALTQLSELRDFVVTLSGSIESILIERIRYWDKKLLEDNYKLGGYILGLMALINVNIKLELLSEISDSTLEDTELSLLKLQSAGLVNRINEEVFSFSHEYIVPATTKWLELQNEDKKLSCVFNAINKCKTNSFESSFSKGRLQAYIRRKQGAIDSYNSALQYSAGSFSKKLRCHKEIFDLFNERSVDKKYINLYLTNLEKIVHVGEYFLSNKELISYNERGIRVLENIDIDVTMKRSFSRQYYHNIAHASLKSIDLENYLKYTKLSLKYCETNIEYAQLLNRLVKCSALLGYSKVGYEAAVLALRLQQIIDTSEDPNLESVILGDIYMLYSINSFRITKNIVHKISKCHVSNRQLCHNIYIQICFEILNGNISQANKLTNILRETIQKGNFSAMNIHLFYVEGLLYIKNNNNFEYALEKFKKSYIECSWLNRIREEITIGNNLLITYIHNEYYDKSISLCRRLIFLCCGIKQSYQDECEKFLKDIKSKLDLLNIHDLSTDYKNILSVKVLSNKFSICDTLLRNIVVLKRCLPEYFCDLEISISDLNEPAQNTIEIHMEKINQKMYLIV